MEPVKVIRIIARLNVGGPALHCLLLTRELDQRGFQTTLVTGRLAKGEADYQALFAEAAPPKIVYLGGLRRLPSILGDLRSLLALVALIRREKPAIVHTHTAKAGVLGRLAALLCGVPVIVHTFHGHVLHGYFSRPISALIRAVERLLGRLSSAVVTLSPSLREELLAYRVAPQKRLRVIPLGRELAAFQDTPRASGALRRELGLAPETPLIGCVGRLVPIKDHATLLAAFAALKPARRGRLLIIGDGELRAVLEQQARDLGIGEETLFLGWRKDLAMIYSDLDILALSSRNEGTPLSIIEAFAAGCPVVATRVGGVPDLIPESAPPGEDPPGLLAPAGDPRALADALDSLLADPELRRRCSAAGRRASARFTGARLADDTARLYRGLLRRSGRP